METTTCSSSSTKVETTLFVLVMVLSLVWFALMLHSCHNHAVQSTVNRAIDAKLAEIDQRNQDALSATPGTQSPTEIEID